MSKSTFERNIVQLRTVQEAALANYKRTGDVTHLRTAEQCLRAKMKLRQELMALGVKKIELKTLCR